MASIRKRGDRQWEARIRRRGYPVQCRTFETKARADGWARAVEADMDRGAWVDRSEADNNTLGDLLERYRDEVAPGHRGGQSEIYRINAILGHPIAKRVVSTLHAKDFADWRDDRLEDVSPASVVRELGIMRRVLDLARKEWGVHIVENPVSLVSRPRGYDVERARRLLPGEERDLLDAASRSRARDLEPIIRLALETAMRRGEILALRWEWIDLDKRVVRLPATATKTARARSVPLSSVALAVLLARAGSVSGPVFNYTGPGFRNVWVRCIERARAEYEAGCRGRGAEPDPGHLIDLRFHDLRHEATSRLARLIPNVVELASITGHGDLKMLQRYYHTDAEVLALRLG